MAVAPTSWKICFLTCRQTCFVSKDSTWDRLQNAKVYLRSFSGAQIPVQDGDGEMQGLQAELEVIVNLHEPVDKQRPHAGLQVDAALEEIRRDGLFLLQLSHVPKDGGDIVGAHLRVVAIFGIDVRDVLQVQLVDLIKVYV